MKSKTTIPAIFLGFSGIGENDKPKLRFSEICHFSYFS
jgi:hypothetical protein